MRILMISHTELYWTPLYAKVFADRGDQVLVASFSPGQVEGVETEFIGINPWRWHKHAYITRVPRVRKLIRRFQPDAVVASYLASNGLCAVLAWDGPTIVSAHGGDVLEQAGRSFWRRRLREALVRFICQRADLVHTVSSEIDDLLIRLGIPVSKIVRIPIGIDSARFSPAPEMPRSEAVRFIGTRRHEPIYDNATILDALGRLRKQGRRFHCTLAGPGYLLDEHKARAESAGIADCVTFTGPVPADAIPDLLRQADVYISASLSDGTSSALLEAMAAGLLPVVSRIPANEPWIEHGRNGLLFETSQADDLAAALARAMDDAELRQRSFAENRDRIREGGDLQINMERFAQAVDRTATSHRSRSS